ncbi:MAG: DJ-1/PfpI family protein [Coprobacillaceae bacterium]
MKEQINGGKMMKEEVLVFIPDNYADWEIAFISAELIRSKNAFKIKYVALSKEPVVSMGRLTVIPDYSISEYLEMASTNNNAKMLLLCGSTTWQEKGYDMPEVKQLVDWCIEKSILIAAICDATTFLANNSYLNTVAHTGNALDHIVSQCKEYTGQEYFVEKQCVSSNQFITANGTATLEFSREIMKALDVSFEYFTVDDWYIFNKNGIFPAE